MRNKTRQDTGHDSAESVVTISEIRSGHAGYKVYACKDGRVAVAALEPHFAASQCALACVKVESMETLFAPQTHEAIAAWIASRTRKQLDVLAVQHDIPLHTLKK